MASHRLADNGLARNKSFALDLPLGGAVMPIAEAMQVRAAGRQAWSR
jgi:hypothetical protein